MLRVYEYTMKKYIKSPSTWIILLLTMIFEIVLGGYLPFSYLKGFRANPIAYTMVVINIVASMSAFLAIFVSVFSAFKATNMLKDEIENKTFLVMLSKPLNRRQILFGKWFALQTTLVLYTLIVSFTFSIALFSFDTGNTIEGLKNFHGIKIVSKNVHIIGFYLWVILIVMSLIFSSITLLISTKLNVGTTIGISIAIGIVIPITTLIKTFTQKAEYLRIDDPNFVFINNSNDLKLLKNTNLDIIKTDIIKKIDEKIQKYQNDPKTFYELGVKTSKNDGYKNLWFLDINFQIQTLSEFITDNIIPNSAKTIINSSNNKWKQSNSRLIKTSENISSIAKFNELINNSWNIFNTERLNLIWSFLWYMIINAKKSEWQNVFARLNNKQINSKLHLKIKNFTSSTISTNFINKKFLIQLKNYAYEIKQKPKNTVIATNDINFYQIIKIIIKNCDFHYNFLDSETKLLIDYISKIISPIHTFMSSWSIRWIINNYGLNSKINYNLLNENQDNTPNSVPLNLIQDDVMENNLYSKIATLIKEKIYLNKVSSESYVDKINILIFYLVIVMILLPTTYFVIRKQDFR